MACQLFGLGRQHDLHQANRPQTNKYLRPPSLQNRGVAVPLKNQSHDVSNHNGVIVTACYDAGLHGAEANRELDRCGSSRSQTTVRRDRNLQQAGGQKADPLRDPAANNWTQRSACPLNGNHGALARTRPVPVEPGPTKTQKSPNICSVSSGTTARLFGLP